MKKTLLSVFVASLTLLSQAATPEMSWNKLIDGPQGAGDNLYGIAVTTDGNIVTMGNFGSRTESDAMTFDGNVIAHGAATNGTSDNYNLLVTKHSASDGSLLWALSTKKGDVASSGNNAIAATADGGAVMLVDMRSSDVSPYESPVIVDASGAEIDFADWNTSCRIKCQVVIKVTKDGYVQWVRRIVADQLPVPEASSASATENTTNGAFPYAIGEDSEGNIYVAGNHRASLIFGGALNSTYVLTPRNLETYNGDVQNYAGGLYLVKLDSEGNYLTHLQGLAADGLTADYINAMVIEDDMIYITGYLRGKEGSSLSLGKGTAAKTVTKLNANNSIIVGAVKSAEVNGKHSLTPQFLECYNEANRAGSTSRRIQLLNISKCDGALFLTGSFQGAISTNNSEDALISSVGTPLEGFVLKVSATDGSYIASMANGISIGGYRNVFSYSGALYAHGYRLNAATGAFIDELDPETLAVRSSVTVAKAGGAPTLMASTYDPATTSIYSATRGSAAFTLTDGSQTDKPQSWAMLLSRHVVDKGLSGVAGASVDADGVHVRAVKGGVEVATATQANIDVVDLSGVTVATRKLTEGVNFIPLPAGIYIVGSTKVAVD